MKNLDENFYYRADEHINLSNRQLGTCDAGKASASMMYATARFNSWLTACGFESATEMLQHKDENIDYFVKEYRKMLQDNMQDYIDNFDRYLQKRKDDS